MSEVSCPYCNEPLVVVAGKVFKSPIPEDNERCEVTSIIHNLRCQLPKNHEGQHEHFPYVWGAMGGPAWWDSLYKPKAKEEVDILDKKVKGDSNE